jgi:hypothetical protein
LGGLLAGLSPRDLATFVPVSKVLAEAVATWLRRGGRIKCAGRQLIALPVTRIAVILDAAAQIHSVSDRIKNRRSVVGARH